MCVWVSVSLCIRAPASAYGYILTNPLHGQGVTPGQSYSKFNGFEFIVIILLDWLPNQG